MLQKAKKEWGLTRCKEEHNCSFCNNVEDVNTLIKIRDLYAEGVDLWSIEKAFDLPEKSLMKHAYRRRWEMKRRRWNTRSLKEEVVILARKRLMENWNVTTDQTPDKMMEILSKAAEIGGRGVVVGVNVNNNPREEDNISWEERAYNRKGTTIETTFTKEDDGEEDNVNNK